VICGTSEAAMNGDIIKAYKRRLKCLQLQAAIMGINTPPEVVIEVEDIQLLLKNVYYSHNGYKHSDYR